MRKKERNGPGIVTWAVDAGVPISTGWTPVLSDVEESAGFAHHALKEQPTKRESTARIRKGRGNFTAGGPLGP